MNHFGPHLLSRFEGYYSKFTLPSGASLALIVCSVPQAESRPHMVSFSYVPKDMGKIYQKELWVKNIARIPGKEDAFELQVSDMGSVTVLPDATTKYNLKNEHFSFQATTTTQIPWSWSKSSPEGLYVKLPLPLHWHVHSLASECHFDMNVAENEKLSIGDAKGTAMVHQEKNWGYSFPSAHIWIQARQEKYGLCAAGGRILGMNAYLVGFRSPTRDIDFRPPFTLSILGISPFMRSTIDWESRSVNLTLKGWTKKMEIVAAAPKKTFFGLSAPFHDGHRKNFLSQSFQAKVTVTIWKRSWWQLFGGWELEETVEFDGASLEFGGDFYPERGSEHIRH